MLSIRSILRGGAPIDPFIAQQILSKFHFEQKVKMWRWQNKIIYSQLGNLKSYNWLLRE